MTSKQAAPIPSVDSEEFHVTPEMERALYKQAVQKSRKNKRLKARQKKQSITFDRGPVCIVAASDFHLGSESTDYDWIDREMSIVTETPGMYLGLHGDMVDNFIVGRLAALNMTRSFSVTEEWVLLRHFLRRYSKKLLWNVSGNHDNWTFKVSGIDFLKEILQQHTRDVMYHSDQLYFKINVGKASYRFKVRHKWKGHSQWNPLHGIMKDPKFDNKPFDVGIGGHTHASGLAGYFTHDGGSSLAVLSGAYKREDVYAVEGGFPSPNQVCAVPIILTDDGGILTTNSLEAAADYMRTMYHD